MYVCTGAEGKDDGMDDGFEELFVGKKQMFKALRDAGKKDAGPQRNVPWVNYASDGDIIVNVWRHSLRKSRGAIYSDFGPKKRIIQNSGRRAKREELMRLLEKASGATVRVMLLDERIPKSGLTSGCKCDSHRWLVCDLANRYELRRGQRGKAKYAGVPLTPAALGALKPKKRRYMSERIERLSQVRRATLERADNRCEIPSCGDSRDFISPDVHHITHLGDAGSDHTDNTIALCPACHARVHRGTRTVRARIETIVERIRDARFTPSRKLRR